MTVGTNAVFDPGTGDRGMCGDYEERQDVSQVVSGMSLNEATDKYVCIIGSKKGEMICYVQCGNFFLWEFTKYLPVLSQCC